MLYKMDRFSFSSQSWWLLVNYEYCFKWCQFSSVSFGIVTLEAKYNPIGRLLSLCVASLCSLPCALPQHLDSRKHLFGHRHRSHNSSLFNDARNPIHINLKISSKQEMSSKTRFRHSVPTLIERKKTRQSRDQSSADS